MRIREITLKPFRNFEDQRFVLDADRILISGANGIGKSNILEAISYLSIGKSVRGSRDQMAIPHGCEHFDVQAQCHDGESDHKLRIYYARSTGKKSFCDESPLPKVSDLVGVFISVHFAPEDVALVLRFPAERRRALDILISQASASYLHDLQQYNRVLAQRNRALRTANYGLGSEATAVEAWDAQFCSLGARIREQRLCALDQLSEPFREAYGRFSPPGELAELRYHGLLVSSEDQLAGLRTQLEAKREAERRQGHTLCGPHRDDLVFTLNEVAAHDFASEGQLKTTLIAWKIAEFEYLQARTGKKPVLLFDDLFSELDEERVDRLLDQMDDFGQILLTTPNQLDNAVRERFSEIRLAG